MMSFAFPKMFNNTASIILTDKEAVRSNLVALLSSEANTLFGDPYFGCQLKKYLFEQANSIIVDLLIDELYTTIKTFMPQVYIERKYITIWTNKTELFAKIQYQYIVDGTSDLFTIQLTSSSNEQL